MPIGMNSSFQFLSMTPMIMTAYSRITSCVGSVLSFGSAGSVCKALSSLPWFQRRQEAGARDLPVVQDAPADLRPRDCAVLQARVQLLAGDLPREAYQKHRVAGAAAGSEQRQRMARGLRDRR